MTTETRERAAFHSPLGFLRGERGLLADQVLAALADGSGDTQAHGDGATVWLRALAWDTRYFGAPVFRIQFADWPADVSDPTGAVAGTVSGIVSALRARHAACHVFADVPSEDTVLLQALGRCGFALVETRLAYVHDAPERYLDMRAGARLATADDITSLRRVASVARNAYDRYHADPWFGEARADAYLADYAEACVRDLADVVVVPDGSGDLGAFVAGNTCIDRIGGEQLGRLLLAAVAPECRGAYRSLNRAFLGWLASRGATRVVNTTQSTNRAVIHVCEELGYRYGRASHVLAIGWRTDATPGRRG